ncbi:MAG: UDP-3-O-(3-hydroxymyristoyl)glucosamine N-acyltransferase [Alphaproteobacteria bacterium]|nr:UDP-3-O-(3-hydroxymyristoyl)glucosamine N-acyltransferase [Alphaproteobacteria bacterium]
MADPRFFTRAGPFTLGTLAGLAKAELVPGAVTEVQIDDVAPLDRAGPTELSFLDNPSYVDALRASKAGACVLAPKFADHAPAGMARLVTANPYLAFALIAGAFYPTVRITPGIDPKAAIDPSAQLGNDVSIAPYAVVGAGAVIGDRVRLGPQVTVGPGVVIGADTVIAPNASLRYCVIGNRCQIHAGARIGERGFGFVLGPSGFIDMPQLGRVVVEDDVEIGANTTIDRGGSNDTVIGAGSRIDNLVQIAHNVVVGRNCVVVAQAGIAGSATLEDQVTVAAQVGIAGHLHIGRGAQIGAQAGVMRDIAAADRVVGSPAMPVKQFFRIQALLVRQARGRGPEE